MADRPSSVPLWARRPRRTRPGAAAAWLVLLLIAACGPFPGADCLARASAASPAPPAPPRPAWTAEPDLRRLASRRDSLLADMERYRERIAVLRDSLEDGHLERGGERAMERAMEELAAAISRVGRELGDLEFDIGDQRISLRDGDGGRIAIDIPPDLGERLSQGLVGITTAILQELPDSIHIRLPQHGRPSARAFAFRPSRPAPPARVRGGDVVRIAEDIYIEPDELVRGKVVAVFGDVLVAGRVTGDVVAVFGDVQVTDEAEIGGDLVVVGRLDQDPESVVRGDVVVIGRPLLSRGDGLPGFFRTGWFAFAVGQAGFMLVGVLALLAIGLAPRPRLEATLDTLAASPGASLGIGAAVAVAGHPILATLLVILILTVIGIPLALLLLLGWAVISALAIAVTAVQVGRRVVGREPTGSRPLLQAIVGLLLLHLVSFLAAVAGLFAQTGTAGVLLAVLGFAIELLAWMLGLGALALSRLGRRRPAEPPVPVYAEPAGSL